MKRSARQTVDDVITQAAEEQLGDALFGKLDVDATAPCELGNLSADEWVRKTGRTPFEFLTLVYRNPLQPVPHRISAAKALLDYSHRKLPQKIESEVLSREVTLDAAALTKLSDKELTLLEDILKKVGD